MSTLVGIRVVEIANWAAAPSAGVLLAEQGAEVIKVEPIGGDSMRGLMHQAGGQDPDNSIDHAFQFSNRAKKSVAIALDTEEGRQVALALVGEADVAITNLLPQRRKRFGLTVDQLSEANPRAIIGVLTGFGDVGPDAEAPGFDLTSFFARSGLSSSVGGFDGRPPRWRAAQGDHVAGLSLYAAIITGLLKRAQTGEGSVVETSLYQAAAWSNAFDLTRAAADGKPSKSRGRAGTANVTSEAYRCADGRFVQLSLAEPTSGWRIMCDVLDLGDLEHDERFATTAARFHNMADIVSIFDAKIATRNSGELVRAISERGGVAAVVMFSNEVVADPQADAVGLLRSVLLDADSIDVVNSPFIVDRTQSESGGGPVAGIGAPGTDSDAVLTSILGMNPEEIDSLVARGVVGRSSPSVEANRSSE